jgi:adenylylsulfate reductase subunit B
MPTFVDPSKCDGCKGGEKTACMYICPNDLMVLDPDAMRAYNQEPDACWECYSCVKICPQGAITARPYADFAPLGGTCIPMRSADSIMWTVNFRDGSTKRFKFPIRTTPEGSIEPYKGWDKEGNLDDEYFYTESELKEPEQPIMEKATVEDANASLTFKL